MEQYNPRHRLPFWIRALAFRVIGAAALGPCPAVAAGPRHRQPAASGRADTPSGLNLEKPSGLYLGLRDFGPWWAELYRIQGEPPSYLVQFIGDDRQPDFKAARLEFGGGVAVEPQATGPRLFARTPLGVASAGDVRLVAEQWDGTVLAALWHQH